MCRLSLSEVKEFELHHKAPNCKQHSHVHVLEDSDPGVPTFLDSETGRSVEGRWLEDLSGNGRKIRLTDVNPKVWVIAGQTKYKRLTEANNASFMRPGMPAWQMMGAR